MSLRTIFLSKLIGLYSLLVVLSMLIHKEATIAAVNSVCNNPAVLLVGGLIALVVGLAIVVGRNVWFGGPPAIFVTLSAGQH
jgi:hypothetical protein